MDSPSDFYGQGRSRYNLPAWELLQEQGCAAHEQGSKWDRSYLSPWRGDRGRGRSEISTLWLSWLRSSLLALATNPLRGYGEDNKASEKMKQLFFYPCVKKKTLQDSSLNHSREKGQRQWNLVQSCSNFVWLCPNTGTWGATKKLMNDLECGNAEQCHVHTGMGFIRSRQRLSCENRDFNVTSCRETEQKNKLKRW